MSNQNFISKRQLESLSVLIVEDNRFFRTLLKTILREFGIRRVREAEDGADALAHMKSLIPDLILLDWRMPVFSGIDFMQVFNDYYRAESFTPSVIVITANATKNNVMEAARLGVDGILAKPIVPALLYKKISEIMATGYVNEKGMAEGRKYVQTGKGGRANSSASQGDTEKNSVILV